MGRVNLNNGEVKVLYSDEEAVPSADNSQGNTSAWIVVLFYKKYYNICILLYWCVLDDGQCVIRPAAETTLSSC